jgi:hypothetical protein
MMMMMMMMMMTTTTTTMMMMMDDLQVPHLGGYGFSHSSLSDEQCHLVQRFDPSHLERCKDRNCDTDTIGFFIAKFRKRKEQ